MASNSQKDRSLRELIGGQAFKFRYPRYRFWGYILCAIFFYLCALLPLYQTSVNPEKVPENLRDWLAAIGVSATFAIVGSLSLVPLPRLRRSYEISDSVLIQKTPGGRETDIKLNEIAHIHRNHWRSSDVVESSSGRQIPVHGELPGSKLMDGFTSLALDLKRYGARGERLIDMFQSAVDEGHRIHFRENWPIFSMVAGVILFGGGGALLVWHCLVNPYGPSSLWWQAIGAAAGFGLVGFASLAVHSLFCHKPQSLTFFREGFEFQGAKGASQIIPYSDIYELLATDTTGISPITVKGPRPEPLAVISREFSAYFAILYLLEHMRARAAGENV